MCFSATASFTAAGVLGGVGALAWRTAQRPLDRPFAAIPWLFAVQQAVEGAIWLTFDGESARHRALLTQLYVLFSYVLWPTWIPLATWLIEPPGRRRRWLAALTGLGAAVSIWLLWRTTVVGVRAEVIGRHLAYTSAPPVATASTVLYMAATALALLISSHRYVRLFGGLTLASMALAKLAYDTWFVSIWCFCAAALSVVVLLHLRSAQPWRHCGR